MNGKAYGLHLILPEATGMLAAGQIIDGKYRIGRCLAEGGMGAVYLGQNMRIGRQVAIKVLHGNLAKQGVQVERFEQEAQLLALVGSEHIVQVLDMGDTSDGDSYMVMEYLEGESLGDRLHRRRRLTGEEAALIVEQALTGLEAAHSAGVVHRDIKPDNLFLQRRPEGELVKILDFGVSKMLSDVEEARPQKLTLSGTLVGTPQYMSPEQARGHETDHRTDLHAMGVVLFECLAGETPFAGNNLRDLLFRVAIEEPRALTALCPDVDPQLDAIVRRATARKPDERYATAREFRAALRGWLDEVGAAPAATTNLRLLPASGPASPTTSDTPPAWETSRHDLSSRPTIEAPATLVEPSGAPRRPHAFAGLLALTAAAALAMSLVSGRARPGNAAVEAPAAVRSPGAAPVVTSLEANPTDLPAVETADVSGASGYMTSTPASLSGVAPLADQRGVRPESSAGSATAALSAASALASAAPQAPASATAERAAPAPSAASPARPGLTPAVIPPTPRGRVFRREL